MSELAQLYVSLGFNSVQAYLQSGNVIFSSNRGPLGLEEKIERGLKERFGFDVKVFIRTPGELGRVIRENPFVKKERTRLYVTFLHSKPSHVPLDKINAARMGGEEFSVSGREVFLFLPNGSGRTKLSNALFEKVLDIPATTRNWNTVTALSELAGHASG